MIPLINCPVCQVLIKKTHFNTYVYNCSNEQCPIKFSERIQFTENTEIENGLLLYYGFEIDNYQVKIIPNMKSGPKISIYCFNRNDEVINACPMQLKQTFDLEWLKSPTLAEKIKTWITFS